MKYEITKEQIVEIYEYCNNSELKNTIKAGWFPEAFKPVLEVGKWYKIQTKTTNYLLLFSDNVNELYVGFMNGIWGDSILCSKDCNQKLAIEATESEVLEALKKEAVRRGFKKGICIIDLYPGLSQKVFLSSNKFDWELIPTKTETWALRDSYGNVMFSKGQWAEIIETISKEEAEKFLNKKII